MADQDKTNRNQNTTKDPSKSKQNDLPPRNVSRDQQDKVKGGGVSGGPTDYDE